MSALLRIVREWIARRRRAAEPFASALERAIGDAQPITLRLSTVERSVGIAFDPHSRASRED